MPGERLTLRLDYQGDLFDRASMVALVERLIRLLEGCVAAPDAALAGLDILSGAERAALLEGFNATAQAVPAGDASGAVRGAGAPRRRMRSRRSIRTAN